MAQTKHTLIDQIGWLLFKVGMVAVLLLAFNSLEGQVTITKKRNSFISTVGDTVEQGYTMFNMVKNIVK